ncbi:MAG: ABC transporter substrate-binding protein [Chloroflexota bacterium]
MKLKQMLATAALLSALFMAACGGSAAPASNAAPASGASGAPISVADIARYQGADRQQILEAGAKKEGAVSWYTVLAGEGVDALVAGFQQKYPFLKVDTFRADTAPLFARMTQEAQANKPSFDVADVTTPSVLSDSGLATPFFSPTLSNIVNELKTGANGATVLTAADWTTNASFAYNKTLIPAAAVPKTFADLMNPALTGKMALAGTTTGQNWLGSVLEAMGQDKGKQFLEQFGKQQKPAVQQISGKALLDLIAKGEVAASPTIYHDHVIQAQAAGAPVDWAPLEPVVSLASEVGIDVKAPHPYGAMLFIDYCLGDGQKVLADHHYSTGTEKVSYKLFVPGAGMSGAEYTKELASWNDLFKADFRG